jgi:hypothetical protein
MLNILLRDLQYPELFQLEVPAQPGMAGTLDRPRRVEPALLTARSDATTPAV